MGRPKSPRIFLYYLDQLVHKNPHSRKCKICAKMSSTVWMNMKTTIKSLWAQHKDDQRVLQELKHIPTTPLLLNRWAEYAVTNNMPAVFAWVIQQLPRYEAHNDLRLQQASAYNRNDMVLFLLQHDPRICVNLALRSAAFRGHMLVLNTLFEHVKFRHTLIWDEDFNDCDDEDLETARFMIAKSACEGRQIDVLQHYIAFNPHQFGNEAWILPLMKICAQHNFSAGLIHLLQWGDIKDWKSIAQACYQTHALQSECLLVLLENIPADVPQQSIQECAAHALHRLVTVGFSKLDQPNNATILKSLTQLISFEDFITRTHSSQLLQKHHDALQDIWIRLQRDSILEHIEVPSNTRVKRKM